MKYPKSHIFLLLMILFPVILKAQNENGPNQIEELIESVVDNADEDYDATMILEDLKELADQPLNINNASREQLSRLHLLNSIQIQKILDYLEKYGPAYSLYELNTIEGLDKKVLQDIRPFIYFGGIAQNPVHIKDLLANGNHELLIRTLGTTQKSRGYIEKDDGTIPFEGNRARYYTRYKFRSGDDLSAGITAEKDPGEAFFRGTNKNGFDFYSAHISTKISPVFEKIIIGDFIVCAGQGLVVWQGFSSGKSVAMLNISKTSQSVRPFTSTNENHFFRGIASTLNLGRKKINIFLSRNKIDGNIIFSDSTSSYFSSLQSSGYHRTKNEIADRNSVKDINTGAVATWHFRHLKIGTTVLMRKLNIPFKPALQLYNYYRFTGKTNFAGGADYLFCKGKYQLFGEAAMSISKGKAFLQGINANIHDQLNFSLLFRHFDKDYHALWASALAESGSVRNESGLFCGIRLLPIQHIKISAYSDMFRSEWINYSTLAPATGRDFQIQTDFDFSEKINFYIRYRNKKKDKKSVCEERYITCPEHYKKTRLHFQYCPGDNIKLKTRLEHVFYNQEEKEQGWMILQDLQYSPDKIPLNISARVALFNTESYNSRIYAYENDLLYTFSIPAYFDKGIRIYMNMKYKISKKIEIWLKLANTTLAGVTSMGSGYNEISGNKKTEVKFQMRLKM